MSTSAPSPSTEQTLHIEGMTCAACQVHVQRALEAVPGVQSASVDLMGHTARITGDTALDTSALATAVRNAGYGVTDRKQQQAQSTADADASGEEPASSLGWRAGLSLLAGAIAMLLSMPLMNAAPQTAAPDPLSLWFMHVTLPLVPGALLRVPPEVLRWILFALASATMLFAAPEIYSAAWRAARHRATNMNTLVALGTLVAYSVSVAVTIADTLSHPLAMFSDVYYEAVVLILAFLLAGRWLEARARHRAMRDLRGFARLEVKEARWLTDTPPGNAETLLSASETLLPLDAVAVGDILRVLPGDRVPLDGEVIAGRSSVDESTVTGEPLPITRIRGDRVLGGTLNLDGVLVLRATAIGADSTVAQMQRLLERARSTRAPLQQLADRASAIFVPTVLALAALTFAVWAIIDNTGPHHLGFARALSLAISVLVIACPCAMGLAVPAAIAVTLGTAARAGLLFKDGDGIERLAQADTLAFDKTGTLTEGRPRVTAFERSPTAQYSNEQLLHWAAAVEQASTHPLAIAIRDFAQQHANSPIPCLVTAARVLPGTGAEANIEGHHVAIGNAALLPAPKAASTSALPQPTTATPMFLIVDGHHQATFFAVDTLRPSARNLQLQLRELNVRPVLLTGDIPASAKAIAEEVGISEVRASLLPADKVLAIESLQREGHRVAMAGDGINDAAALAQADAGIAVASGSDLARDAGHILLLHHNLNLIPLAIRLARKSRRLMRQNLAWALLYNVIGLPIAAGLLLPRFGIALSPALASAAMAFSSVSVLLNSLRLTRTPSH